MARIQVCGDICLKHLLQFCVNAEFNEHGRASFTGMISNKERRNILEKETCFVTVHDETEILFVGYIQKYTIKCEGSIYYLKADCVSTSIMFDQRKKSRSFQNTKMTYGQVFKLMEKADRKILAIRDSNRIISYPIIQYEETDWEFIKRMARRLKTIVLSDMYHMSPQILVGMVQGKTYMVEKGSRYELEYDRKQWKRRLHLKVDKKPDWNLCDKISYKGDQWIILKKSIRLIKGELEYEFWGEKEPLKEDGINENRCFQGLKLSGKVVQVTGERIRIKLDIDKENEEQKLYDYPYLPITGNGMYAMPETGSNVFLYFPDNEEKNAFVVDCLATDNSENRFPYNRHLKTPGEKVIAILQGEYRVESGKNRIRVKNGEDTVLSSDSKIRFWSKGKCNIKSKGFIFARGKDYVHAGCEGENQDYLHLEGMECLIKAKHFWSSDLAGKVENLKTDRLKMAWRIEKTVKKTLPKVLGAIPAPGEEGISGMVLGGIPGCDCNIDVISTSEITGIVDDKED